MGTGFFIFVAKGTKRPGIALDHKKPRLARLLAGRGEEGEKEEN